MALLRPLLVCKDENLSGHLNVSDFNNQRIIGKFTVKFTNILTRKSKNSREKTRKAAGQFDVKNNGLIAQL